MRLLRREGGLYRLQVGEQTAQVHDRARQDAAATHERNLRATPAFSDFGDQAGAPHLVIAVRNRLASVPRVQARHPFTWVAGLILLYSMIQVKSGSLQDDGDAATGMATRATVDGDAR